MTDTIPTARLEEIRVRAEMERILADQLKRDRLRPAKRTFAEDSSERRNKGADHA